MIRHLRRHRPTYQHSTILGRSFSSVPEWRPLRRLDDGVLENFRVQAFIPSDPALLPRGHFLGITAIEKWFLYSQKDVDIAAIHKAYLSQFGNSIVPLEFTRLFSDPANVQADSSFQRADAPLQIFLDWAEYAQVETLERLYLAQASFGCLPERMIRDLPTPELVTNAGTGDIYDTNIWMGIPPTYTPLHRDPNPNLFVQLAGRKILRLLPPDAGEKMFAQVQTFLGQRGSAVFRGEEMMKGEEKRLLENLIWSDAPPSHEIGTFGYEAHVDRGDGLFIPKGWWHSIKGVGKGVTGSVNWWFR